MTNKAILVDKTGVIWAYGFTRFTICDTRYLLVVKIRGLPVGKGYPWTIVQLVPDGGSMG